MTREEREKAIAYGKRVIKLGLNDETQAFCELAIKALKQEHCEDAVSRKEVIDTITHWFSDMLETGKEEYSIDDVLNSLPSVTPTQRWIPCSERLPNIHNRREKYYVTLKCGDVDIAMFTECNGEHWWNFNFDDVIAWMPLPPIYKENEPLLNYADQDTMQPAT